MSSPPAPARVAVAAAVAVAIALGALAYLAPIAGDDWGVLIRAHEGRAWTGARSVAAALHALVVVHAWAWVAIAPLVLVALIAGATALVLGRVPDPREPDDVIAAAVVLAAIIVAVPRFGVAWTQRALVGHHALGLAAALWIFVPARTGARLPAAASIALGLVAGASTRAIAAPLLPAVLLLAARDRHARAAAAAAVLGAALVWLAPDAAPRLGRDPAGLALVQQTGSLCLWLAVVVVGSIAAGARASAEPRDLGALGWLALAAVASIAGGWLALGADRAAWLAPTTLLALCAARIALSVAHGAARAALAAAAGAVVAVTLASGVIALHDEHARAAARIDALRAAPGAIATAPPATAGAWSLGEDLGGAAWRERVAFELFGARDLELAPAAHDVEPSPGYAFHATGAAAARDWGRSPEEARRRFAAAAAGDATLVLDLDDGPPLAGRAIVAARADHGAITAPAIRIAGRDARGRLTVIAPDPELYAVRDGQALALTRDGDRATFTAPATGTYAIVGCDRDRCALYAAVYLAP